MGHVIKSSGLSLCIFGRSLGTRLATFNTAIILLILVASPKVHLIDQEVCKNNTTVNIYMERMHTQIFNTNLVEVEVGSSCVIPSPPVVSLCATVP